MEEKSSCKKDLVALAKAGDKQALNQLAQEYIGLASHLADGILSLEKEDLIQEGMIAFLAAVSQYNERSNAKFSTYSAQCMRNAMLTAQKKAMAKKRSGDSISLDLVEGENFLPAENSDPQQIFAGREALSNLRELLNTALSNYERKALLMYLSGDSYRQIADKLNKTEKSVENALGRARKKLIHAQIDR